MLRINKDKIIVLDIETTGLPSDFRGESGLEHEILQLAFLNGTGSILINERFRPMKKKVWAEAQIVHGIAPKDVQNKSTITDYISGIQTLVDSSELIVAYNLQFDLLFLQAVGISFSGKYYYDVMIEFARKHGKSRGYRFGKFVPLRECASYYGYNLTDAHDAEEDARATLHCFLNMQGEGALDG